MVCWKALRITFKIWKAITNCFTLELNFRGNSSTVDKRHFNRVSKEAQVLIWVCGKWPDRSVTNNVIQLYEEADVICNFSLQLALLSGEWCLANVLSVDCRGNMHISLLSYCVLENSEPDVLEHWGWGTITSWKIFESLTLTLD